MCQKRPFSAAVCPAARDSCCRSLPRKPRRGLTPPATMERGRGPRSVSELPSLVADEIKAIDADEEGGVPEVRATGGSKRRLLSHDGDSVSCFSRLEVKASNHGAKWTLVLIWTLVNIFVAAYGARFEAREDYRDLRAYTGPGERSQHMKSAAQRPRRAARECLRWQLLLI